jgi:uncharacterized protein (TIGR03435 family)
MRPVPKRALNPFLFTFLTAVVACLVGATPAQQPARPSDTFPGFEVSTIKPSEGEGTARCRAKLDGISARNLTVRDLIRQAYRPEDFPLDRITGLPAWAKSSQFDLETRVADSELESIGKLDPSEREYRLDAMLRLLLADRFQLQLHRGSTSAQILHLLIRP